MNRRDFISSASLGLAAITLNRILPRSCSRSVSSEQKPNIVLIYADDLGYGDISCYGAHRVTTPNIDRLAKEGIRFTEAYAPAATCTPSRYSLLTGQYAWRREGTGIAPGDAPLIIPTDITTLPSMLSESGYTSGVIGKWHLGLGEGKPDWNGEIKPGPCEIGFDYSFIIPATGDRVPCVFVENHRVVGLDPGDPIRVNYEEKVGNDPTGLENPELLKFKADRYHSKTIVNGISRIGYMSGGKSARWVDEDIADVLTKQSIAFIERNRRNPFFLYFALHDIHVPRAPHPRFVGKTDMGPRGDAIVQADWCVGQILDSLERLGIADNTLVIFSSDNGPVTNDGYEDQSLERLGDHKIAGPLRGGKYSSFEGGTRIPFIVRWSAEIKAGESQALVSQIDLMASLARLTGYHFSPEDAPDSIDILPALLGKSAQGREYLVQQALGGYLSIRNDNWKYIPPGEWLKVVRHNETGRDSVPQLYNLDNDIHETVNLAEQCPEIVSEMQALLEKVKASGDRFINMRDNKRTGGL